MTHATSECSESRPRADGGDPRNAVQLGGERHSPSTLPKPAQAFRARDLVAAVVRCSRANSALADAMRAALERRRR